MPEYKVITQKDRYFRGKFNPEKLELAINDYAQEGWRLVSMASAEFPGFGKERSGVLSRLHPEIASPEHDSRPSRPRVSTMVRLVRR